LFFYSKGRGYVPKHNKEKKKVKALGKTMAFLLAKERKTRRDFLIYGTIDIDIIFWPIIYF
jgi:hypothetical protein